MRRKSDHALEGRLVACIVKGGCPFNTTVVIEVVVPVPVAVAKDLAAVIFACEQANAMSIDLK